MSEAGLGLRFKVSIDGHTSWAIGRSATASTSSTTSRSIARAVRTATSTVFRGEPSTRTSSSPGRSTKRRCQLPNGWPASSCASSAVPRRSPSWTRRRGSRRLGAGRGISSPLERAEPGRQRQPGRDGDARAGPQRLSGSALMDLLGALEKAMLIVVDGVGVPMMLRFKYNPEQYTIEKSARVGPAKSTRRRVDTRSRLHLDQPGEPVDGDLLRRL